MDTVRESALAVRLWEKNPLPHRGLEPASVLRLAFLLKGDFSARANFQ